MAQHTREMVVSIWEVKDIDEAVVWAKRCPNPMPGRAGPGRSEIEIRPFFEAADLAKFETPEELSTPREGSAGSSASPEARRGPRPRGAECRHRSSNARRPYPFRHRGEKFEYQFHSHVRPASAENARL